MSFEGTDYYTVVMPDGRIRGNAYGTNIGFIQMGCDNGSNMNSCVDCTATTGVKDYGVRIAMKDGEISGTDNGNCGTMNKGDLFGYAWTNTVGWMNFRGAHVDLDALAEPPPDPPVDDKLPDDDIIISLDPGTSAEDVTAKEPGQAAMVQGNFGLNIVETEGLPVAILDDEGKEIDRKISTSMGESTNPMRERLYRSIKKKH